MDMQFAGRLREPAPVPIRRSRVPTSSPAPELPSGSVGLASPAATVSRLRGRDRASWLTAAAPTIQRTAGNRAVADLVAGMSGPPHVQRCGGVDPASCSCHDGEDG
jgi:hypothetical protein